jgi:hypothetical protein
MALGIFLICMGFTFFWLSGTEWAAEAWWEHWNRWRRR